MRKHSIAAAVAAATLGTGLSAAQAGITVYEDGDKYLEFGGRIQAQYHREDPDDGETTDDFFLRRLRLYMEGSITENISGIWQVDFGKNGGDPAVKDAFIQYSGFEFGKFTIGNHYVPFSREALTSSKRQQLVERTFVGDHNYGAPDRNMGISLSGGGDFMKYAVGVYEAGIDPDPGKLDFDTRVNDSAEYFGKLVGGRLDFFPIGGAFKFAQGDFDSDTKLGIGVNAYTWNNDEDEVEGTLDSAYDKVTGMGIDAAFRSNGFSVDAEYNRYNTETVGSGFTGGLIENGDGDFNTYAIEGGYMVIQDKLELVVGHQALDADAYDETWRRNSVGFNWFINKHTDKVQFTFRQGSNEDGVDGADNNEIFLQFQHVI